MSSFRDVCTLNIFSAVIKVTKYNYSHVVKTFEVSGVFPFYDTLFMSSSTFQIMTFIQQL